MSACLAGHGFDEVCKSVIDRLRAPQELSVILQRMLEKWLHLPMLRKHELQVGIHA